MSRRLLIAVVIGAVALAAAPAAFADPYKFRDRVALEKSVTTGFISLMRRQHHVTYRVRSIGCAKAGVGRARCAVVATGPRGTATWAVSLTCANDAGADCTMVVEEWPS